ncbi:MAG: arylsulfatase [Pseudoclavibacter sp.]
MMLVDDMGFSDIGPFGSEIPTPAIDELASGGFRLTNFHVTPLCSPTRAALMTGVNPHRAGFGHVSHIDPGYPGVSMRLPSNMPTMAESFRHAGYRTCMVGKWHLSPETELHDAADKSSWPLQRGFERYFGSMDGFTTMYHPHRIVRDNSPVTEEFGDDDYLTDRLTDEALGMIDSTQGGGDRQPFFLYYAHHAVHGPVQATADDMSAHAGRYDDGWDAVRQQRFERQVESGLFPEGTELPEDREGITPWDDLDAADRRLFARHMEVYAGAVSAIDRSVARIVARLKELGEYENTVFVFTSDNGGTGEGGLRGTRSYFSQFAKNVDLPNDWVRDVPRDVDQMGGPRVHGHYPQGWAHVSNTPFRRYKGTTYEGGIRSPFIIGWPAGLRRGVGDDGIRSAFVNVTDVAPTLLDLAGVDRPDSLGGRPTEDPDGLNFGRILRDARSEPVRTQQYVCRLEQRAEFSGQFKVVAPVLRPDDGGWELYDLADDPTEIRDIAGEHPELVADLVERWRTDAWNNAVFPLPDEPTFYNQRPSTIAALEQPVTVRPGAPTLERFRSSRLISIRSFSVEARFSGGIGEGILVSHGDQGGGYVAWIESGKVHVSYNAYGEMHRASAAVSDATSTVVVDFAAVGDFRWQISVASDGDEVLDLGPVPMLIGLAPFTGISAGFGQGPVDWELHERRGRFAHSGTLAAVRYVPGVRARENSEVIVSIDAETGRLLD